MGASDHCHAWVPVFVLTSSFGFSIITICSVTISGRPARGWLRSIKAFSGKIHMILACSACVISDGVAFPGS